MTRQEERAVAIALDDAPVSGLALEGLYVAGSEQDGGGAVIAPPHPLYGGSMDSPVATELAWACARCGVASLRFNWRGVGASGGEPTGSRQAADADYRAALRHVAETVTGPILACGYSFGAAAAVRSWRRHRRVSRLLLVAPPPALFDRDALEAFAGRGLVICGGADSIAPASELRDLAEGLAHVRVEVLPQADHFFGAGLAALGRAAADWLAA